MPTKKRQPAPKKQVPPIKLPPEKQELANMILKWSRMVDNPKNKEKCDELFRKIWKLHDRMGR